jgi:glycosyltransferase involved in cell wall biosynthesis
MTDGAGERPAYTTGVTHGLPPRALQGVGGASSRLYESDAPLRIALLGIGAYSYTSPNVAAALRRAFPAYEVDLIDLIPLCKDRTHNLLSLFNAAHAIRDFGRAMGLRLWELKWRRGWTSYLFRLRSRVAVDAVSSAAYAFSIQLQSTFDASVPGVPHFVYTDNTMLVKMQYKNVTRRDLPVTDEWLALERRLYHNARICFVMSRNVSRSMIEDYGCDEDKVVCAFGGPNAPIEPIGERKYDQKNILFVGINWERKGGPELVQSFRLVRQQIPDATLTIVGCSPKIKEVGCHVVGRVRPTDLGRYYANASVFCMPTRQEPFGIVYLEAMAYRMPIVATDVAAIPDFVANGENGFRVSPGDTVGLADALVRLLSNPELCRQMGERSREVSNTYAWDNTASIMRRSIQRCVYVE